MKVVVFGAGGVGGFFGAKLARSGAEVWFVARGAHLDAMRKSGLQVQSTEGTYSVPPGSMTDTPADIGPADVILFCVKAYDTQNAALSLAPMLTSNTIVISLQNGIDNEERILQLIPRGEVLGGVAQIYSTITAPGVITESGGPRKIIFGHLTVPREKAQQRAQQVLGTMLHAGINAELTEDIYSTLWKKFIFITAVGGLTALTRLTLGELLANAESKHLVRDAMQETERIARGVNAHIEPGFIDQVFELLKTFNNNTRSSLYHDLVNRRPLEIQALSGTVAAYGERLGIPTPIHRTIYASLLPYHIRHTAT